MSFLIINTETKKVNVQHVHQPDADLIAFENDILVIKVPGHRYQYGYSSTDTVAYAPTEYQVFRANSVSTRHNGEILVQADRLLTFPLRVPKDDADADSFTCVDLAMKNLYNHATLQLGEALDEKQVVVNEKQEDLPLPSDDSTFHVGCRVKCIVHTEPEMFGELGMVLASSGRRYEVFFDSQRGDADAKGFWLFDIELEAVPLVRCAFHLMGADGKGCRLYQREVPEGEPLDRGAAGECIGMFEDRYAAMEKIEVLSRNCSEYAIFE